MKDILSKKIYYFEAAYLCFIAFIMCAAAGSESGLVFFRVLSILMFGLYLFKENNSQKIDFEKTVILSFGFLFGLLILFRGKIDGRFEVINILCIISLLIATVIYFKQNHNGILIKKFIFENRAILLVIVAFILLSMEVINWFVTWDAKIYSREIQDMMYKFDADFSGIYDLYLASHATLGYSLWVIFFQLIRDGIASMQIADIILAGISIFAYYLILKKLLGRKYTNQILALATVPFAFSPFVLGIIGIINIDSAAMYFAIIFIACSLYNYECLELIFAFLFCFTKENAVIYYVVYIIAKIVCEYVFHQSFHFWGLLKFGFGNVKNYMYAIPAALWMFLYKLNSNAGWGSEEAALWDSEGFNCFGISQYVIPEKLKQIFFINFNWFFWVSIVLGIIIMCVRKFKIEKELMEILIPISVMGLSMIAFGCLYITYVLPRYIVPIIPIIYLLAVTIIGNFRDRTFIIWSGFISIFLLIQSFYTIDPVMSSVFPTISIGYDRHEKLNRLGKEDRFDDHMVYNRQSSYWSEAMIEVLEHAGYNGNMLIVLNEKYYFDCRLSGSLWNLQTGKLEYYNKNMEFPEQCKWVETCRTTEVEQILSTSDNKYILYIIPKFAKIDLDFISDKQIIKQGEINNKGFNIQYLVMRAEANLPLDNGTYVVSTKQDGTLGICTDGQKIYLSTENTLINLFGLITKYNFVFDELQMAMDVKYDKLDSNGTVWVWEINHGHAQQWLIEEVNGYYMICWDDYALTYNINDKSVRLTPKTGTENQLWSFTN